MNSPSTEPDPSCDAELEALLPSAANIGEFTDKLIALNLEQAEKRSSDLAFTLEACAIPRSFDSAVIGVIRGTEEKDASNDELLAAIREFGFVEGWKDGTYAYHDTVRSALLRRWASPARSHELANLKTRLGAFYRSRSDLYVRKGDLEKALSDINRSLELQPASARFRSARGSLYSRLGQRDEALKDFASAIENAPDLPDSYVLRASELLRIKDYQGALSDLDQAIRIDPKRAYSFYLRGAVNFQAKDYVSALRDANKAIEVKPSSTNFWARGLIRRALKEFPSAIKDFDRALQLRPKTTPVLFARALARSEQGDLIAALEDLTVSIELEDKPQDRAYHWRGLVNLQLGENQKAVDDLAFVKASKDNEFNSYWLGLAYLASLKFDDSDVEFEAVQQKAVKPVLTCYSQFWRAVILKRQEAHSEANTMLEGARSTFNAIREVKNPWRFEALVAVIHGDWVAARGDYRKVLDAHGDERISPHRVYLTLVADLFPQQAELRQLLEWFNNEVRNLSEPTDREH